MASTYIRKAPCRSRKVKGKKKSSRVLEFSRFALMLWRHRRSWTSPQSHYKMMLMVRKKKEFHFNEELESNCEDFSKPDDITVCELYSRRRVFSISIRNVHVEWIMMFFCKWTWGMKLKSLPMEESQVPSPFKCKERLKKWKLYQSTSTSRLLSASGPFIKSGSLYIFLLSPFTRAFYSLKPFRLMPLGMKFASARSCYTGR